MKLRNSPGTILKGLNEVNRNLNREIENLKGTTMKGLIEAAILIRDDMDTKAPSIPVDLGNLRASWFVVTAKSRPAGSRAKFKDNPDKPGLAAELAKDHTTTMAEAQAMCAAVNQNVLIMGFTANYAMWVHEMVGKINWNRKSPQSGPKFFEAAIKFNAKNIVATIAKNAKIK